MAKAIFEGYVKELTGPSVNDPEDHRRIAIVLDDARFVSPPEETVGGLGWNGRPPFTTAHRVRLTVEPIEEADSSIPGSDPSSSFRDTDGYAHLEGIT